MDSCLLRLSRIGLALRKKLTRSRFQIIPLVEQCGFSILQVQDQSRRTLVSNSHLDLFSPSFTASRNWSKQWSSHVRSGLSTITIADEDTLLSYPASLSADQKGDRLFISDTNHHRVLVVAANGKILECIGSVPGYEDGSFGTARLFHPAGTFFDETANCLYVADTKNHVIRRACMNRRTVETVGQSVEVKETPLWRRLLKWMVQEKPSEIRDGGPETPSLDHPFHLGLGLNGFLVVANQKFESLWLVNLENGHCETLTGRALFEEFKSRSIAATSTDVFDVLNRCSRDEKDLISKVAVLRGNLFYTDTEGHVVRKMDLQTGGISAFELSNFGLLGIPYWWSMHPISLISSEREQNEQSSSHDDYKCPQVSVPTGRCTICIDPILPEGMILATPVENGSVWRQARGSIVELSTFGQQLFKHKVSGAQQWLDGFEDLDDNYGDVDEATSRQSEDTQALGSLIDASVGTGEILVDAVLYVKRAVTGDVGSGIQGSSSREDNRISDIFGQAQDYGHNGIYPRLRRLHVRVMVEVTDDLTNQRTKTIRVRL